MVFRSGASNASRRAKMLPRLLWVAQAIALVALASATLPYTSALAVDRSSASTSSAIVQDVDRTFGRRHGDDEHEEEEQHAHADGPGASMEATHAGPASHTMSDHIVPGESNPKDGHSQPTDAHNAAGSTGSDHAHTHSHAHEPNPYDSVPTASEAGLSMIVVPPRFHGSGGHSHGHGGEAPKMDLNETKVLRWKGPDPLSYIEWDFAYGLGKPQELERFVNAYESSDSWSDLMGVSGGRYRHLVDEVNVETRKETIMDIQSRIKADKENPGRHTFILVLHVIGCILSCFVLLPAALALRAASSNLAPFASLVYLVTLAGSLFCSTVYKAMTPRLYPSNSHSGLGYAVFWLSLAALGGDVLRLVKQIFVNVRSLRGASLSARVGALFSSLSISPHDPSRRHNVPLEEERMLSDDGSGMSDARELDLEGMRHQKRQGSSASSGSSSPPRSVHFEEDHIGHHRRSTSARSWTRDLPSPTSTLLNTPRTSVLGELPWKLSSEDTYSGPAWRQVDEHGEQPAKEKTSLVRSLLRYSHVTVARSIPLISFAAAYTGLSVYTGSCRGPYQNTCLAHGIKGGIFFWYGLLSFGRYLGAYADLGWAWNRKPASRKGKDGGLSAEWVECFVIFLYGATNTWMERFGAAPGDPYSVKQVQHISIAVMFCFAGLMGLILETKWLKSLLAFPVSLKQVSNSRSQRRLRGSMSADEIVSINTAPPSYSFSFNPFPALVIGVTGLAMAAHHQDYVYEVSIHSLWGNLLAGFSVLRMMTYFFLWLRPPTSSIMPSRPPSEALASFSLTCGGLVFMLSSEEVSMVAMRNGFGDFMMVLNVTVAIVSLLFCGTTGLMVLKAWAVKREHLRLSRSAGVRLEEEEQADEQHGQRGTFIIGNDDEHDREQDEKRQLSSSPEQV